MPTRPTLAVVMAFAWAAGVEFQPLAAQATRDEHLVSHPELRLSLPDQRRDRIPVHL